MKGYIHKIPRIFKFLSKELIWRIDNEPQSLFLTFDDGPNPKGTSIILDCLRHVNAKATFFCQGNHVAQYPDLYQQIIEEGHAVGNHTHHHLSGWKTPNAEYYRDINKCSQYVQSNLFRPPYGQITKQQIKILRKQYYLVMYNLISGDFDESLSAAHCYKKTIRYSRGGDIILFHDNLKSCSKIGDILFHCLEHWHHKGFIFKTLSPQLFNPAKK